MLLTLTSDFIDGAPFPGCCIVAVLTVDISVAVDDDVDIFSLFLLPPDPVMMLPIFDAINFVGAFTDMLFKPLLRKFAVLAASTNTIF